MKMLSRTLRLGARLSSWWMIAMPRRAASTVLRSTSRFAVELERRPRSAISTPLRIFISVDLPAPFSPNSTVTAPRRTSKSTPLSARVAP